MSLITKLLLAATLKCSPALTVCHALLSLSFTSALPLIICMISALEVAKLYSPWVITPTLAGAVLLLKLIDFTAPLKYSLMLSIVTALEGKDL